MAKPKTKTVKKRTGSNTLAKDRSMETAFLLIVLVLLAFGLIMVFSASYAYAYYYNGNSCGKYHIADDIYGGAGNKKCRRRVYRSRIAAAGEDGQCHKYGRHHLYL